MTRNRSPIDPHRGVVPGPGAPVRFDPVEPGLSADPVAASREIRNRDVLRRAEAVRPVATAATAATAARRSAPDPTPASAAKGRERGGSGRPGGGSGPGASKGSTSTAKGSSTPPPPTTGSDSVTISRQDYKQFLKATDIAIKATEQQQRAADRAALDRRVGRLPRQSFALETRRSAR